MIIFVENKNTMITKNKIEWTNHILNFLAVCMGIAITFSVQGLINSRQERNEVKASLILVKNELTDNLGYVELTDTVYEMSAKAAKFLIQYEGRYEQAPEDSMNMYCNIPLTSFDITHSSEALELLKNSSLFTKIKDQELSLDIIHTYGMISDAMKMSKYYQEHKEKYLEDAMSDNAKSALAKDNLTAVQLWNAITSTKEGKQYIREIYRLQAFTDSTPTKEAIKTTLAEIDEYLEKH